MAAASPGAALTESELRQSPDLVAVEFLVPAHALSGQCQCSRELECFAIGSGMWWRAAAS